MNFEIWIDGACSRNPGPGGYAVVMIHQNKLIDCYVEYADNTTNNAMELAAALKALELYGSPLIQECNKSPIIVYSDSAYTVNTLTKWKTSWKLNNWTRPKGQPVLNLPIIQKYDIIESEKGYKIDLRKVEGHSGLFGNEIADKLASRKITKEEAMKIYG